MDVRVGGCRRGWVSLDVDVDEYWRASLGVGAGRRGRARAWVGSRVRVWLRARALVRV